MTQKTQDILHWILVIALTGTALEPTLKAIIPARVDAALAVLFAAGILFNYYATTTVGTTIPTPPTIQS